MLPEWGTAVRVALAALLLLGGWRLIGPTGLVLASVGVAALLARPAMAGLSGIVALVRRQAYRRVDGAYFAYHGAPIDVIEDEAGYRWLRAADLRRVVDSYPRDALLLRQDPIRVAAMGRPPAPYVRADALLEQLQTSTAERTQRFRSWVERDVVFPSPAHRRARASGPAVELGGGIHR